MSRMFSEAHANQEKIFFPGDLLQFREESNKSRKIKLDEGLVPFERCKKKNKHVVLISKVGKLKRNNQKLWSVKNSLKKYLPRQDDSVVGIIKEARSWEVMVEVGASKLAKLSLLAFEGATKRNKPMLEVGSVLYCRLIQVSKDLQPELSCKHPCFKQDWVTGQSIYGELKGGYVINLDLGWIERLLQPDSFVLKEIAKYFKYEVALGFNGMVWIKAQTIKDTIIISNILQNAHGLSNENIVEMISSLVEVAKEEV